MNKFPLSTIDAMTVTIVITEEFMALDFEALPNHEARGVVLFYDQIMQRVRPLLPRTPDTEYLFTTLDQLDKVASAIRNAHQAPEVK